MKDTTFLGIVLILVGVGDSACNQVTIFNKFFPIDDKFYMKISDKLVLDTKYSSTINICRFFAFIGIYLYNPLVKIINKYIQFNVIIRNEY